MQSGSTPKIDDQFASLRAPSVEEQQLQLQQLVQQGILTPEQAQAQLAGRSEMDNISLDPKLKQAQMDALSGLEDISGSGGLTAMDKAKLNQIENQENTSARGARDAILQNAQARGLGGSGLELMSQMQNQQDSATRKSTRDMDVAAMAQQRALDALIQGGQMAGNIQGQQFNQQAQSAQANDAISKFNAQNQNQFNLANTQARNQAQEQNLAAKQNISNANVGLANQQQQYNKQLLQQQFQNEMQKRGGQSQVAQQNAANAGRDSQNQANATNQLVGGLISGGATVLAAKDGGLIGGDSIGHDGQPAILESGELVVKKDDVPEFLKKAHTNEKGEFDAAGFLDSITGHKYGYKKKGKK